MYSDETAGLKKSRKFSFRSEMASEQSARQQSSQDKMSSAKNTGSMSYKQRQKVFD